MKPIAVFYHTLFFIGYEELAPLSSAVSVTAEQMTELKYSGLEDAASEIHIGINGSQESDELARKLLPSKARVRFHGLKSRSENLTLVMLENWVKDHPGWACLYFHAKGSTHPVGTDYSNFSSRWRRCMMNDCVKNWRRCVKDLDEFEAVGSHWLTGMGHDHSQHYFAGNFYWGQSDFLATIPSIFTRERIKISGIESVESRYEAEVILGNGPRLPTVKSYATHGFGQCP